MHNGIWYATDLFDNGHPIPFRTWVDRGVMSNKHFCCGELLYNWVNLKSISKHMNQKSSAVTSYKIVSPLIK